VEVLADSVAGDHGVSAEQAGEVGLDRTHHFSATRSWSSGVDLVMSAARSV